MSVRERGGGGKEEKGEGEGENEGEGEKEKEKEKETMGWAVSQSFMVGATLVRYDSIILSILFYRKSKIWVSLIFFVLTVFIYTSLYLSIDLSIDRSIYLSIHFYRSIDFSLPSDILKKKKNVL